MTDTLVPARSDAPVRHDAGRRRWIVAGAVGGALGLLVHLWMLTAGSFRLFRWQRVSDFYDAQAHAWLDGRWDIDDKILGIEAFRGVGGRSYMYQGPVPALLRVPVAALTDRLDGRLTALSMWLAAAVTVVGVLVLGWQVRRLVRGDRPVGRSDVAVAATLGFAGLAGTSLLYNASRPWVYHEAIAWGVAFSLAAYAAVVAYLRRPTWALVTAASALATLAFNTRASVGGGPVAALGLLAGLAGLCWLRERVGERTARWLRWVDWFGARGAPSGRWTLGVVAGLGAAVVVPVAVYAAVNQVKFGQLFSVPFYGQRFSEVDPARQEMLALNNGSLFNWKFIPTNLLQYARPDMVGFSRLYPFVGFPAKPTPVLGQLRYDLIDRSIGLPVAVPALVLPGLVGVVAVARRWRWLGERDLAVARIPILAAILGTVTVLNIGYIANRYLSDFLPLVLLAGLVGIFLLLEWLASGRRHGLALAATAALAGLAIWGVVVNLAVGTTFQRAYGSNTRPDLLAGYIGTQHSFDELFGDGRLPNVSQGDELPPSGRFGDLFVLGDCDAVYWSDGMVTNAVKNSNWNAVERSARAGAFDLHVTFTEQPPGTREPLLTSGGVAGEPAVVWVEHLGDGKVRLGYNGPGVPWVGVPKRLDTGKRLHVHGWADPTVQNLTVYVGDEVYLESYYRGDTDLRFGVNDIGVATTAALDGEVTVASPSATPLCERLRPSFAG